VPAKEGFGFPDSAPLHEAAPPSAESHQKTVQVTDSQYTAKKTAKPGEIGRVQTFYQGEKNQHTKIQTMTYKATHQSPKPPNVLFASSPYNQNAMQTSRLPAIGIISKNTLDGDMEVIQDFIRTVQKHREVISAIGSGYLQLDMILHESDLRCETPFREFCGILKERLQTKGRFIDALPENVCFVLSTDVQDRLATLCIDESETGIFLFTVNTVKLKETLKRRSK
jgi:hypothetical protein